MTLPAFSDSHSPSLRISTHFMETFQPVVPASGGTSVALNRNAAGHLDIYTAGSGDELMRWRIDEGARAGYRADRLGVQAREFYLFSPLTGDPQWPDLIGVAPGGQIAHWQFNGDFGKYLKSAAQPPATNRPIQRLVGAQSGGNVYAVALQDDGRLVTNFMRADGTWSGPRWAPLQGEDGKDLSAKEIAVSANNPVQASLFAIGLDDRVLFAETRFRVDRMKPLGTLKVRSLSVVSDASNLLNVLVVDLDGALHWKRQKKYSASGAIEFHDWQRIDADQQAIVPVNLRQATISLRFDGSLEIFGIGADGGLHYARQVLDARGEATGWLPLFPMGEPIDASIFAIGWNEDGSSELVSVSHDNRLFRFWQSDETSQWFRQEIGAASPNDQLASVPTHAVELTILDERGVAVPFAPVTLAASFRTTMTVDGRSYVLGPVGGQRLKADAAGKLVVHQVASSLSAASLIVATAYTPAGRPHVVEPNLQLKAKLAGIEGGDVLEARRSDGTPLLPEAFHDSDHADNLAQLMRQAMALGGEAPNPKDLLVTFQHPQRSLRGWRNGIDFAQVSEQHWEIDFSDGFPWYRPLDSASVNDWLTMRRDQVGASGFLGVDWGAPWEWIKEQAENIWNSLKKIVVTTIIDPVTKFVTQVKVFFHLVIDGVSHIFESALHFLQQAFDFIEGVWAWLKAGFKELYDWLALLFNWPDIRRTAEALRHATNVSLDFAAVALVRLRGRVEDGFDSLAKRIRDSFDQAVNAVVGDQTIGNFGSEQRNPDPLFAHAGDHNVLINAYAQNYGETREVGGNAQQGFKARLGSAGFQELLDKLEVLAENFQFGDGKQAFEQGVALFSSIGDHPSQAVDLAMAGVMRVVESIALFGVAAAKGVVLSLFDLVIDLIELLKDVLNTEWEIPVVSNLFELITGKKLAIRPVDIATYGVAIPATILYKLAHDKRAPFPDDGKLDAFRNGYTVAWLEAQAGWTSKAPAPVRADASGWRWDGVAKWVFKASYSLVLTIRIVVEVPQSIYAALGADPQSPPTRGPLNGMTPNPGRALNLSIASVSFRFVTSAVTVPWAWKSGSPPPGCRWGTGEVDNMLWIVQILAGPTRGALILLIAPASARPLLGEISISIWGAIQTTMILVNELLAEDIEPVRTTRRVAAVVPAQLLRFLALPQLNKNTYMIPVLILSALIVTGYAASAIMVWFENDEFAELRALERVPA